MTHINKQKFLAELGKLLTFMYDEDRQAALTLYSRMFDDARDEQLLLQFLISPTRQAVVIARAYNARERKLQVDTQSRDSRYEEKPEGTPDFVRAIAQLREEATGRDIVMPEVPSSQLTLFGDEEPDAASEQAPAAPKQEKEEIEAIFEAEPVSAPLPAVQAAAEEVPLPDGAEEEADIVPAREAGVPVQEQELSLPAEELDFSEDEVNAFLSEFAITDNELERTAEVPEKADRPAPVRPKPPERRPVNRTRPGPQVSTVEMVERKPRVALLLLYILLAVPLSAVCVALLLIPTLLFLALAVGTVVVGCMGLTSAFGAFTIFADVMVVLGWALIILALGLLFMWLFIWMIAGPIAGFVNGVIRLGGKWCYKEVPTA